MSTCWAARLERGARHHCCVKAAGDKSGSYGSSSPGCCSPGLVSSSGQLQPRAEDRTDCAASSEGALGLESNCGATLPACLHSPLSRDDSYPYS